MARYIEGWAKCNPSGGLANRSFGQRQSGMASVSYLAEHPKARGLVFTRKGELDRRFHNVRTVWRGGTNPITGFANY